MILRYSKLRKANQGDYWYIWGKLVDVSSVGHDEGMYRLLLKKEDKTAEDAKWIEKFPTDRLGGIRQYAIEEYDAMRISQNNVEVSELDSSKLKKINRIMLLILGGKRDNTMVGIQVNKTRSYYFPIPLEKMESISLQELRQYNMYVAAKKADFGGDFQNVNDIRPDPGNVYPGRNREYLKKQEDDYTKILSNDDNGEFVHTHPEHCPRYDLRKLKIQDEGEDTDEE